MPCTRRMSGRVVFGIIDLAQVRTGQSGNCTVYLAKTGTNLRASCWPKLKGKGLYNRFEPK
ncbi:MAG: hypothetical protein KIT83_05085 [Bryobacterales bacterium]|nr:hypothetical protein [Bryobacterales bacterium]